MSLILASSKQSENRAQIDSENPSHFTNFFRSPIEVEPNSEIAVQSVKINRSGNVVINGNNKFFCHYFGSERYDPFDADNDIYLSRTIQLQEGRYNINEYPSEVQRALNAQYAHPVIFGNASVSVNRTATGDELGLKIQFDQRTSGSGVANQDANGSLTGVPVYQLGTSPGIVTKSDQLTFAGDRFSRIGATGTDDPMNGSCIGIMKGRPFSLNSGRCQFEDMVDAQLGKHWVVGLSRPQIEVGSADSGTSNKIVQISSLPIGTEAPTQFINADGDPEDGFLGMCDYCVFNNNNEIIVLHYLFDEITNTGSMVEVQYYNTPGGIPNLGGARMTKSAWYASYDGVRFTSHGDEIRCQFKQKGKTVFDDVVGSNLAADTEQCFVNIGETNNALYPYCNLGKGDLQLARFETNYTDDTTYKFPEWDATEETYTPGSDMFSNEVSIHPAIYEYTSDTVKEGLSSGLGFFSTEVIDSKPYRYSFAPTTDPYEFEGLNPSGGVYFRHQLTMGSFPRGINEDTITPAQEFPNANQALGFNGLAIVSENDDSGYVSGSGTNTVVFTGFEGLQKSSITSFIRIPNLTHKSFNGAQQSLSKIVYQVPQFTNDGTEFGPLFFEPGEKTYIALNNPSKMILNSLQVQFVDYEEHELDSLDGVSQVVFHVRKMK